MSDFPATSDSVSQAHEPWYPTPPVEDEVQQAEEDKAQNARLASSVAVVDDVLKWFDAKIESTRGAEYIQGVNPATDPQTVKETVLLLQSMHAEFVKARQEFADAFDSIIKKGEAPTE